MRRRPFMAAMLPAWLAARGAAAAGPSPMQAASLARPGPGLGAAPGEFAQPASDPPPIAVPPGSGPAGVPRGPLQFPADHGAHADTHVEWWYVTGWLRSAPGDAAAEALAPVDPAKPPELGFQVTFFRVRTGLAEASTSRFAPRQLVFAHVVLTDLAAAGAGSAGAAPLVDQRVAREGFGLVQTPAAAGTQVVRIRDWSLSRGAGRAPDAQRSALRIDVRSERFALGLALQGTQPLLLQGDAGYSRKGPREGEASRYYSEPQLAIRGRVERAGAPARDVVGRAWLDHEWSNEYLPAEAFGWDWVGFNLFDGAALMAFRMRRADGSLLWAGGSFRDPTGRLRIFASTEVVFRPGRRWRSPRTQVDYPVEWTLDTPAGRFRVAALRDDQELDSRRSTGSIYWEGVSALQREDGQALGWGYLELTGYAERLRL